MVVKVVNKSKHNLPAYAHVGDAGMDLKADIDEPITIKPGENALIPTGLYTQIPRGGYGNIKSRSGLAAKYQVIAIEGVVDSIYTGEWKVNLMNLGKNPFVVYPGDRIAQAVFYKYETVEWDEVRTLDATERGEGGFGSSGK